jgi:chaperonin GroES
MTKKRQPRMLNDRVLIRRLPEATITKGGIIIPETYREKPMSGEVVSVGTGRIENGQRIPLDVSVGDEILFAKYSGMDIKIGEEDFLILKEDDVLMVV